MKRLFTAIASVTLCAGLLVWGFTSAPQRTQAMPPFAEATGQNCTLCHTMMPGLNAYGRYILRTFYGAITWDTFHGTSPAWINQNITGRSTGKLDPKAPAFKETWGNVSADVSGLAGHWSYRAEQSFYSNNQSGGNLGNVWVAYDNILNGDMQMRVGKFSRPVPSVFTNNWYRTGMSAPSVTVGTHAYALSGSSWGAELSGQKGNFIAEGGYYVSQGNNLPNAASFAINPGTQRSFSYNVAYARPTNPLEIGVYGSVGSYTQTGKVISPLDQFAGTGVYIQRDAQPLRYIPGFALIYQITNENNPGVVNKIVLPPGTSYSRALQVEEPLFNGRAMFGVRKELVTTTTGLQQGGVIDLGVQLPHLPYMFLYGEEAMGNLYTNAPNGKPTFRWALRTSFPVIGSFTKITK